MTRITHAFHLLALSVLLSAGLSAAPGGSDSTSNDACLRCHALSTLGVRDTVLGGIRNLSVSPEGFKHSIHGDLDCVHCHTQGYASWPHSLSRSEVSELACTNCHQDPKLELKALFGDIQKEYTESIHVQRMGDKFSCFSCHDPHVFQRQTNVSESKIEAANNMCLNCHESDAQFARLTSRERPVLEATHAWLPSQQLHWKFVRCVDCHSSYDPPNVSHKILPREQAVTKCESCHSQNSVLLAKLYKYEHRESQQKLGFVNGVLLNDAYVIGSTRNPLLDMLSGILFALTLLGVGGHAFLRYSGKKKAARTEEKEETES